MDDADLRAAGRLGDDPAAGTVPLEPTDAQRAQTRAALTDRSDGADQAARRLLARAAELPEDLAELARRTADGPRARADLEALELSESETLARLIESAGDPVERLAALSSPSLEWATEAPPKRPDLLTFEDRDHRGDRCRSTLLHRGVVGLLVAPGGVGKTQALVQLAIAVASGGSWLERYDVDQGGRVLLALAEEDATEIRRRVWKALRALRFRAQKQADHDRISRAHVEDAHRALVSRVYGPEGRLYPLGLAGCDVGMLNGEDEPRLEWATAFRRRLTELGPWSCIILDPLSRWGGPNVETDNHAATRAITILERLTSEDLGSPAVLMAHHANKAALSSDQTDQGAARGASGLVDGARWVANLDSIRNQPHRVRMRVVKSNYAARPAALDLCRDGGGVLRPMTEAELTREAEDARKAAIAKKAAAQSIADAGRKASKAKPETGPSEDRSQGEPTPVRDW